MTVLYLLMALLALAAAGATVSSNRFARQRNLLEESWRQIDVELTRRHELVPALVSTVSAYAGYERGVVDDVLAARDAARGTTRDPAAEQALDTRLPALVALAEQYPALRADGAFRDLQAQLADTEDRLAAGRRFHNGNVRAYNTRIDAFPSSLVASAQRLPKAEYVHVADDAVRAAPSLDGLHRPAGLEQ